MNLRLLGLLVLPVVGGIPMKVTVKKGERECLYDLLQHDERVTASAFVLSGSTLKATMSLEGPIGGTGESSTMELWKHALNFRPRREQGHLWYQQVVDFEHLNVPIESEEDEDDDGASSEEDLNEMKEDDPEYKLKVKELREKRRQKAVEKRKRLEENQKAQQAKMRQEGDPVLYTTRAPATGWYRMCLEPDGQEVVVEMEMRKESELGAVDEDGHVITFEEKEMAEEDAELDKDTASQEGIKDEDFADTKDKLKEMRRLVNQVQQMQQNERRRVSVQAETNTHAHSRMVLSSVIETLFFMAITGFQVYTIRKWFSGAPSLGR